ncbi:hypothetical protein HG532_01020 [Moraxella osloensis]|nr:hypothetical protein [Moraxella osloensis]MBW4008613.1 hypothetical protein [Moraxella osloensis]
MKITVAVMHDDFTADSYNENLTLISVSEPVFFDDLEDYKEMISAAIFNSEIIAGYVWYQVELELKGTSQRNGEQPYFDVISVNEVTE